MKLVYIAILIATFTFATVAVANLKPVEALEVSEEVVEVSEANIAAFVHCWNLKAYVNESLVRFYDTTSSRGVRFLTIVNVDVTFTDEEYLDEFVQFIKEISFDWHEVSNIWIVHIFDSEGKMTLATDEDGEIRIIGDGKSV